MRIIPPVTVTDSLLISSSVSEDDYTAYSSATTYATGNRCIVVATHKIYESAQNSNLNHYPPDNLTGTTPYWYEVGATNRWRMLDNIVGSQTEDTDEITVSLDTSTFAKLAFLNIEAVSLDIQVVDNDTSTTIMDESIDLLTTSNVVDAWSYFFGEFRYTSNIEVSIPYLSDSTTTISLINDGGTVKCGDLIIGNSIDMGCTQFGASIGILDYSSKEVDTFGNYTILQRSFSKKGNFDLVIDNSYLEYFFNTLQQYRSTPVLWIGTNEQFAASALMIYGFYKDFSIVIPYPSESSCSIEIEGLI